MGSAIQIADDEFFQEVTYKAFEWLRDMGWQVREIVAEYPLPRKSHINPFIEPDDWRLWIGMGPSGTKMELRKNGPHDGIHLRWIHKFGEIREVMRTFGLPDR